MVLLWKCTKTNYHESSSLRYVEIRKQKTHRTPQLPLCQKSCLQTTGNEIMNTQCSEWKVVDGHCAERTCNDERVAFIEKTPRVKNPLTGEWEEGPKGAGGSGVDGVNGGYQPSRDWADTKLIEFGYTLEKTSILKMVIDGNTYWLKDNMFHRENCHAIELKNGIKYWCRGGLLHREDGPAIEYPDGGKEWHQNGMLHRLDGPAMSLSNGHEEWYVDGKKHREDGPAVIHPSGHRGFWINGKMISELQKDTD
jgi:hypothetical protein